MKHGTHRAAASALLLVAGLLLVGIWIGLPARYALVDAFGTLLGLGCVVAGGALLMELRWAVPFARALSGVVLASGCATVSALLLAVSQLAGSYGPVGAGGAVLMGVIAALVLPYTVGLPILLLRGLRE